MKTITIEITNENALKALQEKNLINILPQPHFDSLIFSGKPSTIDEFKDWISDRENGTSLSLKEAKALWVKKRKHLQKFVE